MEQRYLEIFEKVDKDELIAFLKSLTKEQRKQLYPLAKKEELKSRRSSEYSEVNYARRRMHVISAFALFNLADFKRSWLFPEIVEMNQILDRFCPEWFSEYINSSVNQQFIYVDYDCMMDWVKRGFLHPSDELIVSALVSAKDLMKYPETLNEHIWLLFQYSSSIYWYDNNKQNFFIGSFTYQSSMGVVDRQRLISESFLALTRNFDKNQSSWYIGLLKELNMSKEELVGYQDYAFQALSSPHSHVINAILNFLKDIDFDVDSFISYMPQLFASEVKSVLKTSLAIVSKIAAKNKDRQEEIALATVAIFLTKDEEIQTKAAKLIVKCTLPTEQMKAALEPYTETILVSAKSILKDYLQTESPGFMVEEQCEITDVDDKIPEIESFEDFIYMTSQALSNMDSYMLDLIPDAMVRFAGHINEQTVVQFEPVYRQAFRIVHPISVLFLEFYDYLIEKYPEATRRLQKIREDRGTGWGFNQIKQMMTHLSLSPFISIYRHAIEMIKSAQNLPILSTPTSTRGLIDAVTLAGRLKCYQDSGVEPCNMDLQLAIQKCSMENIDEACTLAETELMGEYKSLILFHLKGQKPDNVIHKNWWLSSAITKRTSCELFMTDSSKKIPEVFISGNFEWRVKSGTFKSSFGDFVMDSNSLKVEIPFHTLAQSDKELFYEFFFFKDTYDVWVYFIPWLIGHFPHNHDFILSRFVQTIFYSSDYVKAKGVIPVLSTVHLLGRPFSTMDNMLLACCLTCSDKTVRGYAIEVLFSNLPDLQETAKNIGILCDAEWTSLTRFTDLIMSNTGISESNNRKLEKMLVTIILRLKKPVKNTKKLLEIYKELLGQNRSRMDDALATKFEEWKTAGNLKKVIGDIKNM